MTNPSPEYQMILDAINSQKTNWWADKKWLVGLIFGCVAYLIGGTQVVTNARADVKQLKQSVADLQNNAVTSEKLNDFKYQESLKMEIVNTQIIDLKNNFVSLSDDVKALTAAITKNEFNQLKRDNELRTLIIQQRQ